jgi:hypothetical protein
MPFDDEVVHETEPLERVHLDLWGRARTPSWSGAVYMMLVSDGGTSMKFPLFLNDKTQETMLAAFRDWVTAAELQTSVCLKRFRIDLGREFNNRLFLLYCQLIWSGQPVNWLALSIGSMCCLVDLAVQPHRLI